MAVARMASWQRWWPFALLCVAASCEWMLTDTWPQASSTLGSEAYGCVLAAVVAMVLAWRRRGAVRWPAVVAGALVLCGPVVGLLLGASLLDVGSVALALALTPVVVVVAEDALGRDGDAAGSNVWPGLAAVGGLLLLIPLPSFGSPRALAALALAPLLTGMGCVLFRRTGIGQDDSGNRWELVAGLGGAAGVFAIGAGVGAMVQHEVGVPAASAVGIDFVLALLSLLALSRLAATRYAARYVLVPLAVLLQGFVFLRSVPTWRSVGCGVLLAGAAWLLLRPSAAGSRVGPGSLAS